MCFISVFISCSFFVVVVFFLYSCIRVFVFLCICDFVIFLLTIFVSFRSSRMSGAFDVPLIDLDMDEFVHILIDS